MANIAISITENGTTTLDTVGKYCDRNVDIVVDVPTGGGGDIEVEPIVLTESCERVCAGSIASQYIELFGDTVSTSAVQSTSYMFHNYKNATIPFEININNSTYNNMNHMFDRATKLIELPKINNAYPSDLSYLFYDCRYLREIPEDYMDSWNFDRMYTYNYANLSNMFIHCHSLRKIPSKILSKLHCKAATSYFYKFYNGLVNLYAMDELVGIAVDGATITSNMFSSCFSNDNRLKNIIFETNEDGSAKTANWKGQTIDLTKEIGYIGNMNKKRLLNYNSGITADKEVTDDASYQALKDDPDWWSTDSWANTSERYPTDGNSRPIFSRYNHDSAVATINSLPDTSAYLATAGGTNTIKFVGHAGGATDGGAINTLTEEEIAVATAKGWTVTLS